MRGDHRAPHVLTHSFPTRRSSDLVVGLTAGPRTSIAPWWTCATTDEISSADRPVSCRVFCKASAAGWVWRHEAWYLNEVSSTVQREPSLSARTGTRLNSIH